MSDELPAGICTDEFMVKYHAAMEGWSEKHKDTMREMATGVYRMYDGNLFWTPIGILEYLKYSGSNNPNPPDVHMTIRYKNEDGKNVYTLSCIWGEGNDPERSVRDWIWRPEYGLWETV